MVHPHAETKLKYGVCYQDVRTYFSVQSFSCSWYHPCHLTFHQGSLPLKAPSRSCSPSLLLRPPISIGFYELALTPVSQPARKKTHQSCMFAFWSLTYVHQYNVHHENMWCCLQIQKKDFVQKQMEATRSPES